MSEDKDQNEMQEQEDNVQETTEVKDEQSEDKKEPTMEERYAELNDRYLRIHAEFDNYRKRTNKEKLEIISMANAGVIKDLLPILDDFERAIQNNEKAVDMESIKEGFNLIHHKFALLLENKGVKSMNSIGEAFDVEIHEAIANVPAPSKKEIGKVIDVVEKGYYLNDKVIRFAKVIVGQ